MPSCGGRLSVRLVKFMYSVEMNKYILICFTARWRHHSSFSIPNVVAPFRRGTGKKSRLSTNIWLWHRSLLDRRVPSTFRRYSYASSVCRDQQTPLRHASVNLVYDRKPRSTLRERQHTEQSLIVRIGKSDAEVIIKKCARRIVAHC